MASYNRVMLIGNLTRDIEMRYLPSGMAVVEVGIAVNEKRKNHDGQWVDDVNFFDIVMYGRTAEIAGEYLSKGSPVFIEGRLKQDSWEKDGQKRSRVRVVCERMQMLGSKDRPTSGSSENLARGNSFSQPDNEHIHDDEPPQRTTAIRPTPRREPQPTGDGPGYDEAEIPF